MNLPHFTFAGEAPGPAEKARAWIHQTSKMLCPLLADRYPGLRFNDVQITANADHILTDMPKSPVLDMIDVCFNVSGCAVDLERHRFVHPSWWSLIPEGKKSTMAAETEGSGKATARAVVSGSKARSCGSWDGTEGVAVRIAVVLV